MASVRLGAVVLPEYEWARTRRIWTGLERMGLDHAWVFDHHSWRNLRDGAWHDSLTVLTAVAAITDRIRIGTMVTTPNFRHPVVLAKQVMTLDEVSGGRFVFGVGAGALGPDALLLGGPELSGRERANRFAEFVELSDMLLRNQVTTYAGKHFTAVDARMIPGCVQHPRVPFAVAASGSRGMAVVARYADVWVTIGDTRQPGARPEPDSWELLGKQMRRLEHVCEEEGRDVRELAKLVNVSRVVSEPYESVERFADTVGRCRELGFTDVVVNYPRAAGVFKGTEMAFENAVSAAVARGEAVRYGSADSAGSRE
ncbi:Luciferase-like monooxygenase [Amycolatopsis pretoriensis]|uniref:Luciferase-like monooxygenase n=1 Tax=Amycolatopsis pretoriensis TaxID=218821 RepID=A0A1H5QFN1_9PSEU|nr:LLM class flavin-dependent oxidoreductase [Amycolatopsis pretoriensis]SEF24654.1 Luciferase-like monooxygenase [Amycolatopsis pretoriensis]